MAIKKFSSKKEAIAAVKEAADRKRVLIDCIKQGYSAETLEKKGFKLVKFI